MSLISSVTGGLLSGGLGGTSTENSSSYGYTGGGTGNSGARATEFNREMMMEQMRYNAEQAEIARQHSALEAQKQRDWQQEMSSTAYQRTVEDLKKAGINPILAASRGASDAGTGAMGGAISAATGAAAGVTDNNYRGENWSEMNAYAYSNLGEAVKDGLHGIAGIFSTNPTTGNSNGKGLTRDLNNSAQGIIRAAGQAAGQLKRGINKR